MRKVSDVTNIPFPFNEKTCCSIYIGNDGSFKQIRKLEDELEAYNNVLNEEGKIVIVWPGQYRSDAFLVDDIRQYGYAKGFMTPEEDLTVSMTKLSRLEEIKDSIGEGLYNMKKDELESRIANLKEQLGSTDTVSETPVEEVSNGSNNSDDLSDFI